jgi:rhamnulokinase
MIKYCLAIDMGASSGRHILGHIENDKLILEEMYRFPNGPVKKDGNIVWDCSALLNEIITGMKKCSQIGKIPKTVGIDTWGVDYILLDKNGNEIMPAYSYRDLRTEKYLNTSVPYEELYSRTGIYKQLHNSIYQLLSDKAQGRLDNAYDMLFLPEYFSRG